MGSKELDLLDKKIMYYLDINSRISASKLAKILKQSKDTINFRIKRLFENDYIKDTYIITNNSKLRLYYYKIYFKFKNTTSEKEKEIFEYLRVQKNIAYLADVEGVYNCIMLLLVRTPKDMVDFLVPFMHNYGTYILDKSIHTVVTAHRFNQKLLYVGNTNTSFTYPIEIGDYKLDLIDSKIINLVSNNARMPIIDIARKIGVDPKVVSYRLKKLEEDKIILGYVTAINIDKLGLQFTQINIALNDVEVKKKIMSFFDETNRCLYAVDVFGKYDLVIEIHVENNAQLNKIMTEFKKKFVNKYNDYDILIVNKELVVVWSAFSF